MRGRCRATNVCDIVSRADAMSCARACQEIHSFAWLGAVAVPRQRTRSDHVLWTVEDRHGSVARRFFNLAFDPEV
jgi:hypothetical protein